MPSHRQPSRHQASDRLPPRPKRVSRQSDYLGQLGTTLRSLAGYTTLAHELIQNADDAEGASTITFDVRDDALVVDNNGTFTECDDPYTDSCSWLDEGREHRCDFHSFRLFASGDKRERRDSTGAFGIGFTSVYQITDAPQLISAGHHWTIHEEEAADLRIEVCHGCTEDAVVGTRFRLPFAKDPGSALRRALKVAAVPRTVADDVMAELDIAVAPAILFLRRIEHIELLRSGRAVRSLSRRSEESVVVIEDGDSEERWFTVEGSFNANAEELRSEYGIGRIEESRSSRVRVAVSTSADHDGLLYVGLPTQQLSGLPAHIDAEFFPSSDRKHVLFEHATEYQSAWNRAALEAAARTLAMSLEALAQTAGGPATWRLILRASEAAREAEHGRLEGAFSYFWDSIRAFLPASRVVLGFDEQWYLPREISVLDSAREVNAQAVLADLGVATVHPDIRADLYQVASGVQRLTIDSIVDGLDSFGPEFGMRANAGARALLWAAVEAILSDPRRAPGLEEVARLKSVAIVPDSDGNLVAPEDVFAADESATASLFRQIGVNFVDADALQSVAPTLLQLCPAFGIDDAVDALESWVEAASDDEPTWVLELLAWLECRRSGVNDDHAARLADLPIYPSGSGGFRPLHELALPGDFDDPLLLTDLIDASVVEGHVDLLRQLGLAEMTFVHYASEQLPRILEERHETLDDTTRQAVLRLIGRHIGDLIPEHRLKERLATLPLAPTAAGWIVPSRTYFPGATVHEVLGASATVIRPAALDDVTEVALRWLGVASLPRPSDLLGRVDALTNEPPSEESVAAILRVFRYLSGLPESEWPLFAEIRSRAWLPASGVVDRWFRPTEIYTGFRRYLFHSQAPFLALGIQEQQAAQPFLRFLDVPTEPEPPQVVLHLLATADAGEPVNMEVYTYLAQHADAPAVMRLVGKRCLWMGGRYLRPEDVFWEPHPFGKYRTTLGSELRKYSDLLDRIGVRSQAEGSDAIAVLGEVADEWGSRYLDDDALAIVSAAWALLERALDSDSIDSAAVADLGSLKCAVDARNLLTPPVWLFFEDRPGLKEKLGPLVEHNIISRPPDGWRAQQVAGVHNLSDAVRVDLVECDNPEPIPIVNARLHGRWLGLRRIAEVLGADLEATQVMGLRCDQADRLQVQYTLTAFAGRQIAGVMEQPDAILRRDEQVIYVPQGDLRWGAIAREVAVSLFPEHEPGSAASGILHVLSADSSEDAHMILDELGYARLADDLARAAASDAVAVLGSELTTDDEQLARWAREWSATPLPTGAEDKVGQSSGRADPATDSRETPITGVAHSRTEQEGVGARGPGSQQSRLRTYVSTGDGHDQRSDADGRRSDVDAAGIAHVLRFEAAAGRNAEEQAHDNAGYDVISRDGGSMRYIEVKSMRGSWGALGVGLSQPQFQMAIEIGPDFWLYVVERALESDARVWPIQDPGRRANQFFYDDGWRVVADLTDSLGMSVLEGRPLQSDEPAAEDSADSS